MHLHFERTNSTRTDCAILSLTWMGKVPDDLPDEDGWKLNRVHYYQDGWLATGNARSIVGVTFTSCHNRKIGDLPLRSNYNLRGHRAEIVLVKWNEPYQKLASCDNTGTIFVWIKYEGRWSIELINDRSIQVTDFSWSHDGRMALICYQDGFVLVGSVSGQRYWSSMLNLDDQISCGIWSPDDTQVMFGTTGGQVVVIDVHGAIVAQVNLQAEAPITAMAWSCEKFKMDESYEEDRHSFSYSTKNGDKFCGVPPSSCNSTNDAKPSVLAVCFSNSIIHLMKSYDDLLPTVIETNLKGIKMEWANSGELLAVAGMSMESSTGNASNGSSGPNFINMLHFYNENGVRRFVIPIPCTQSPVTAMTWGHNDKRLFIATGCIIHVGWVTQKIASLQLLARLAVYGALQNDALIQKLPLPQRLRALISHLTMQTIKCHLPDPHHLREFVSKPPSSDIRFHCTMIRHEDDDMTSSATYTMFLEYLGGLVPLLKGKRVSKLRPEFVIFDPQSLEPGLPHPLYRVKNCQAYTFPPAQLNTCLAIVPLYIPSSSSDSEVEEGCASPRMQRRKRGRRHMHGRNETAWREIMYIDELPESEKIVSVTSNIWGTKFKILGLVPWLPAVLGTVTYRTSLLHLQPRQMTLLMKELRGPQPREFNASGTDASKAASSVVFSEDEDDPGDNFDDSIPIAPMTPKKQQRSTYRCHLNQEHEQNGAYSSCNSNDYVNFIPSEEFLTFEFTGEKGVQVISLQRAESNSVVSVATQTSVSCVPDLQPDLIHSNIPSNSNSSGLIFKNRILEKAGEKSKCSTKNFSNPQNKERTSVGEVSSFLDPKENSAVCSSDSSKNTSRHNSFSENESSQSNSSNSIDSKNVSCFVNVASCTSEPAGLILDNTYRSSLQSPLASRRILELNSHSSSIQHSSNAIPSSLPIYSIEPCTDASNCTIITNNNSLDAVSKKTLDMKFIDDPETPCVEKNSFPNSQSSSVFVSRSHSANHLHSAEFTNVRERSGTSFKELHRRLTLKPKPPCGKMICHDCGQEEKPCDNQTCDANGILVGEEGFYDLTCSCPTETKRTVTPLPPPEDTQRKPFPKNVLRKEFHSCEDVNKIADAVKRFRGLHCSEQAVVKSENSSPVRRRIEVPREISGLSSSSLLQDHRASYPQADDTSEMSDSSTTVSRSIPSSPVVTRKKNLRRSLFSSPLLLRKMRRQRLVDSSDEEGAFSGDDMAGENFKDLESFQKAYIRRKDTESYRRWIRMDTASFQYLLKLVTPFIMKENTRMRESISPAERLALTLRHLATGETQSSLFYQFRVAQNTISTIIPEVCDAIYNCLKAEYLNTPHSDIEWKEIAKTFHEKWNFPMCLGAMDGKHVEIVPPPGSGSMYYNYKQDFSVVLLALVDAQLKFRYVDVGTNGRISDGGVWAKSELKKAMDRNDLNIPTPENLPGTNILVPYVLLADDAFPLGEYIMKPFAGRSLQKNQRIFNYRLSRARRVVENAFGILAARFRIFRSPIATTVTNIKKIVLATCVLHNFLRTNRGYISPGSLDKEDLINHAIRQGDWRNVDTRNLTNLPRNNGNNSSEIAKEIRQRFSMYFNSIGSVSWQDHMCNLH